MLPKRPRKERKYKPPRIRADLKTIRPGDKERVLGNVKKVRRTRQIDKAQARVPHFWVQVGALDEAGTFRAQKPLYFLPIIVQDGSPVPQCELGAAIVPPLGLVIGIAYKTPQDQFRTYVHKDYVDVVKAYGW